jgi:hypothetical protein
MDGPFDDQTMEPTTPSFEKWGDVAYGGFQIVPDLLLKNQKNLGLNATEMVVLLNVLMHWWYRNQKPFPRSTTISKRMGITVRSVQRALIALEDGGLLEREKGSKRATFLNPDGLVRKLSELAKTDVDYLKRTTLVA